MEITTDLNLSMEVSTNPTNPMENFNWTTEPILKAIAFALIVLVSTLGNLFVLISVLIHKDILASTTNYFITNLALADLLVSLAVLPFAAIKNIFHPYWAFGSTYCWVWSILDDWTCSASILSLTVISFDRYIGVTKPLLYPIVLSKRRALLLILLVWILAFLFSVPPLLIWPLNYDAVHCPPNFTLGHVLFSVYGTFMTPMIIILIFYWRIYKIVRNYECSLIIGSMINNSTCTNSNNAAAAIPALRIHYGGYNDGQRINDCCGCSKENSSSSSTSSTSTSSTTTTEELKPAATFGRKSTNNFKPSQIYLFLTKFQNQTKGAKQLGLVVGAFLICWAPYFITLFCIALGALPENHFSIFRVFTWFGYMNSCLNPFIYVASSKQFKVAFKKILFCCSCCNKTKNTTLSSNSSSHKKVEIQVI